MDLLNSQKLIASFKSINEKLNEVYLDDKWKHSYREEFSNDVCISSYYCKSICKEGSLISRYVHKCDVSYLDKIKACQSQFTFINEVTQYIIELKKQLGNLCVVYNIKDIDLIQFSSIYQTSIKYFKKEGVKQIVTSFDNNKFISNNSMLYSPNIVIIQLLTTDVYIGNMCKYLVHNSKSISTITFFSLYREYEPEEATQLAWLENENIYNAYGNKKQNAKLIFDAFELCKKYEKGSKYLIDNGIVLDPHKPPYGNPVLYKNYFKILSLQELIKNIDAYINEHPDYNEDSISPFIKNNNKFPPNLTVSEILKSCVYFWDSSILNCKFSYFYHYYPTTVSCRLEKIDYSVRNMIWSFKNDKSGEFAQEQYQKALDYLLPKITKYLKITFGDYLDKLTLVCIPASSKVKNQARFNIFSERLCELTGMNNGYPHIVVKKDRPQRKSGGKKIDLETIDFNRDFFKDKYILLFDDLITTGSSMIEMKNKLEEFGSKVICGFSIGKTEHNKI